ncbi:MAG: sulfatase-like hydrolase/transferase [Erysipelotrichaceae bacterium]|nr:sulfatase-like hydrolase/transferase [Erysipelotrichaceae bacterium]
MAGRPNILLITTDQQRYDTLHCAGYEHMITPNLDELAEEGCLFTHAFSNNPVCIPARHNLLTGLGCKHHTFDDNYFDDSHQIPYHLPTFAQCLSDAGYDTIAVGKMHFQPYRRHNGFHRLYLMDEIPRFREDDDYALYLKDNGYEYLQSLHGVRHMLYMQPQRSLVDEAHHGSTWVADKTIEYLKTKSKDKPFMIWAGFIAPHPPLDVPENWADLYKEVQIPEPTVSKTPLSTLAQENIPIADYPNKETLMRARELYYAAISFVDKQVGRIVQQLKDMDELENTMIVFTSDHGEMLGDLGTYQKFLPYDASCRIPMIVRWPQMVGKGTVRSEFVDLNDLFPTMMDAAGLSMPKEFDYPGASIFSDSKDRTFQFIEHQHASRRWVSVRTQEYKYNYYYGGGKEELFDLVNDQYETENLFVTQNEKAKEISCELRKKAVEMEKRHGLNEGIMNDDFISLEDFKPNFYRENNPPFFPAHLSKQEDVEKLWSLEQELEKAIEHEPVVDLNLLDQDYFSKTLDLNKIKEIQKKR